MEKKDYLCSHETDIEDSLGLHHRLSSFADGRHWIAIYLSESRSPFVAE